MFHPAMANVLDVVWTKRGLKMVALENENTELTKEIAALKASLQELTEVMEDIANRKLYPGVAEQMRDDAREALDAQKTPLHPKESGTP